MTLQAIRQGSDPCIGVLLVGHGTRSDLGRKQCGALAHEIAAGLDPRLLVSELAYLEMATPTIEEAVVRLVGQQIERVVVVPLLLFAAGHAKEDIPGAVRRALNFAGSPKLPVVQTEPLGLQEAMIALAAERFREAADPQIRRQDTCLLLIGRGSRDAEATADMHKFGRLLHERLGVGETRVGFLAMAQPNVQDLIQTAKDTNYRQIIVQPHLLFHGELLDRLEAMVQAAADGSPDRAWHLSRVLGDESAPLARILLQGIRLAGNIQ